MDHKDRLMATSISHTEKVQDVRVLRKLGLYLKREERTLCPGNDVVL